MSTTVSLTSYPIYHTFTGPRWPAASRPRRRTPCPEPPLESSVHPPSLLSLPPPSSLSAALSKFSTLQSAIASSKSARAKSRLAQRYVAFTESANLPAFPVSEQSIALFLIHFVLATEGSTKSLSTVLTALRQESALLMLPWLLPGAELSIARLVSQLKFEDTGDTLRKAPLQEHHLQSLLPLCDLTDAHDLLMVTILYLGHDGLLRAGEIVSGLRPRDVIWGPGRTSMSVRFARSKTHRTGGPFQVFFKDRPTPNAVSLMRKWFDLNKLDEPASASLQLFPRRLSRARFLWSQPLSYDALVARVKRAAQMLGLDRADYSGHSLRAGGATDLFVARTPYYVIKKMGRWLTDSAMIYYRHEEDVAIAVHRAFRRVADSTARGGHSNQYLSGSGA